MSTGFWEGKRNKKRESVFWEGKRNKKRESVPKKS
jgi:hypothetical protein